jgi:hypothetical protein
MTTGGKKLEVSPLERRYAEMQLAASDCPHEAVAQRPGADGDH